MKVAVKVLLRTVLVEQRKRWICHENA